MEGFKILPQKGKKPHIWQIEKKGSQKHYSPAITNTGCIRDYHSLDHDQEHDHKTIESLFSTIESKQAKLVQSIVDSKDIPCSQIRELSELISLMRYRIPVFATYIENSHRKMILDTFKIMYRSGKFGSPPEVLQQLFESKRIDETLNIKISNWKIIEKMIEVGFSPESISLLSQLSYQIYYASEPDSFVTSDNPVALFHPNYDDLKPYGVGLAIKGVELTFPLSSDTLVVAGHHLEPGSYLAKRDQVNEYNRRTIIMGENYIFSNKFSVDLHKYISKLKNIFAGFTYDNLYYGDGSVQISRFISVQ
ncbi:ABC-type phosphate transport system, ATPase component [Candidatus Scalindua japonica]|uniref:ABC-type phosphate transport system, ATPase component n=1 Tax=Candidatus Scalindua japonica TaxID=1284222 RepID=A0A286TX88_9BACT|nr:ABC-type phosphate transport system, ATPase component [Candidatus Scalindua japonica]